MKEENQISDFSQSKQMPLTNQVNKIFHTCASIYRVLSNIGTMTY